MGSDLPGVWICIFCVRSISLTMHEPGGHFCFSSTSPAGGLRLDREPTVEAAACAKASICCLRFGQLGNPYSRAITKWESASENFEARISSSLARGNFG